MMILSSWGRCLAHPGGWDGQGRRCRTDRGILPA